MEMLPIISKEEKDKLIEEFCIDAKDCVEKFGAEEVIRCVIYFMYNQQVDLNRLSREKYYSCEEVYTCYRELLEKLLHHPQDTFLLEDLIYTIEKEK